MWHQRCTKQGAPILFRRIHLHPEAAFAYLDIGNDNDDDSSIIVR